jgi:hypothetical protein
LSNNAQQKFKQWLNQIIEELVWATCYFKVWEQLWPSTEEIAHVENLYLNFFQLTRKAHNDQFLLQLSKILDRHKDSINIFRLIEMIEKQPSLITERSLDIDALRTRLSKKEEVLKRLKTLRDKKLAHIDEQFHINTSLRESIRVYVGEAKALLNDLAEILTEISVAHNGSIPVFETIGIDDTGELLKMLISIQKKDNEKYCPRIVSK